MDKKRCTSCGETPKCACKNKDFTKAVVEIDNPGCITLMHKVTIPASLGDDTAVPPAIGKYKNVLLYYEANGKSYLYSSDGIPTQLNNGITDYNEAANLPQINGVTLTGNKTSEELGLLSGLYFDYSTSEMSTGAKWINDKPIYKKTVDLGALPNNTTKSVAHGLGNNIDRVIKIEGYSYSSSFGTSLFIPDSSFDIDVAGVNIEISTSQDLSMYEETYATIYYTRKN